MSESLPRYTDPPVAEVVLGIQFGALKGFTSGHAGAYWQEELNRTEWPYVYEQNRLQDDFEKMLPGSGQLDRAALHLRPGPQNNRLQLMNSEQDRIIQVQDTRFISNWKRVEGCGYPSFRNLLPEFESQFSKFCNFLARADIPSPTINQWEVVYVNYIHLAGFWESPSQWCDIAPIFAPPTEQVEEITYEGIENTWRFMIGDQVGRLYVQATTQPAADIHEAERMIRLQFTARGPAENYESAIDGFHQGHIAIVKTFTSMISPAARETWGYQE